MASPWHSLECFSECCTQLHKLQKLQSKLPANNVSSMAMEAIWTAWAGACQLGVYKQTVQGFLDFLCDEDSFTDLLNERDMLSITKVHLDLNKVPAEVCVPFGACFVRSCAQALCSMYVRQLLSGSLKRAAMHAMMRPCTIVWRQAMHLCGCRLMLCTKCA